MTSTERPSTGRRVVVGTCVALTVCLCAIACRPQTEGNFWAAGRTYEVLLSGVSQQAGTAPSVVGADTVTVVIHVDSVLSDSLFGTYTGNFAAVGLLVGRASPGPQYLIGKVTAARVQLELSPDATDAGLLLDGRENSGAYEGSWNVENRSGRGTFLLWSR